MGIYAKISAFAPQQFCVLCGEGAKFCVCSECEATFSSTQNRCQSCAQVISNNLDFCGQCLGASPIFNRAYTLYDYQGVIADLIKKFKYNHQLCIGDYFAHKLHDLYQSIDSNYDVIIPMPLSTERTQERGYNQVLELLRIIKKRKLIAVDTDSCQRIKATKPLSSLKADERKKEIKGAFHAQATNYKKVLLVDDVITTGASLNELAKTLIKAGTQSCDVLTLSRAVI